MTSPIATEIERARFLSRTICEELNIKKVSFALPNTIDNNPVYAAYDYLADSFFLFTVVPGTTKTVETFDTPYSAALGIIAVFNAISKSPF